MRPADPRLTPLTLDDVDEETAALMGAMGPLNIFTTLARHPKLMKRWLVFGGHVLAKNSIDVRERELVILRVGWLCQAAYEFGQHTVIARDAGISEEEIRRTTEGPDADGWTPLEAALLRACDELVEDHCISDATWAVLAEDLSEHQLIDLIFTVGQYTLVSMALNSLGVPLDEGVPGFPEDQR